MLAVLKKIASLDVQDRRSRQEGRFGAVFKGTQYICTIVSQGVKTGERVLIKLDTKKPKFESLEDLGMRPKMRERFKELIDEPQGFMIVSTPPGGGLTTLWRLAVSAADRFVRDFVCIEDDQQREEEIINVGPIHFDSAAGQTPADILPRLLLKQPDVFVVPELIDARTIEMLCNQVIEHHKMVVTRVVAKDAAEALLRLLALNPPREEFAQSVTAVLNSRLVRRLCQDCRQPYQPQPQVLQRLGIPPSRVSVLYRQFQPPPPEQRVDEKGRPIEIPICQTCGGLGYHGRTGIFEMLEVTDQVRDVLTRQPSLDNIRRAAKASGHRSLQEEGIVLMAQGTTSWEELQRVMK
jgi:type II secretory ATPase GspE/PulE/Tfp pilus assembly ATPase PilB-like protein